MIRYFKQQDRFSKRGVANDAHPVGFNTNQLKLLDQLKDGFLLFNCGKKERNNKKHSESADTSTSVTFDLEL